MSVSKGVTMFLASEVVFADSVSLSLQAFFFLKIYERELCCRPDQDKKVLGHTHKMLTKLIALFHQAGSFVGGGAYGTVRPRVYLTTWYVFSQHYVFSTLWCEAEEKESN